MSLSTGLFFGPFSSSPGPGNGGEPKDPGPLPKGDPLPTCPATEPACTPKPKCDPATDADGCRPPGCEQGDASCDPGCGKNYCCQLKKGLINPDGSAVSNPGSPNQSTVPNQSTAPNPPSIPASIKP